MLIELINHSFISPGQNLLNNYYVGVIFMCEGYCTKYYTYILLPMLDVCVIDSVEKLEVAKAMFYKTHKNI